MKRAATSALVLAALFNPKADAKWVQNQLQRNVANLAQTGNEFTEMIGLDGLFAQGEEGEEVPDETEEKPAKKKQKVLRCIEVEEGEDDVSLDDLIGGGDSGDEKEKDEGSDDKDKN